MNDRANPQDAPAIAVRGVHVRYGKLHALGGIDLDVRRGEILGLIGHNGAGKSTLFKSMLGLLVPTSGSVHVLGAQTSSPAFRTARARLGYLPEHAVLYDKLSGLETLHFFARLKNAPRQQCEVLLERVGLSHAARRPVREYSKGMRQRLAFAQALLGDPQVLLLDEPTNGLDPQAIRDFYAILRELQQGGTTVVISSHILAELHARVDRLAILAGGHLQALGSVAELRARANMPLHVDVALAAEAALLAAQLGGLPGVQVDTAPSCLRVTCPLAAKLDVLAIVSQAGPAVRDVTLSEASLEDIYFHLPACGTTEPSCH